LRKTADLIFGLIVLGVLGAMVWAARDWSPEPRLFPWTIGIPAVVLAIFQVVMLLRQALRRETSAMVVEPATESIVERVIPAGEISVVSTAVAQAFGEGSPVAEEDDIPPALVRRRTIEMSLWILLFVLGILVIGFKLGAGLLTFAFLRFAGERWRTSVSIAVGMYLFFYLIFDLGLHIPFPGGWIANSLNLTSLDSVVLDPIEQAIRAR
jgi:hypothetical protein